MPPIKFYIAAFGGARVQFEYAFLSREYWAQLQLTRTMPCTDTLRQDVYAFGHPKRVVEG